MLVLALGLTGGLEGFGLLAFASSQAPADAAQVVLDLPEKPCSLVPGAVGLLDQSKPRR